MKVNKKAVEMIRAEKCLSQKEVTQNAKVSGDTFTKIKKDKEISPQIVGKIARALGVPVTAIIIDEPDQEVTA